MALVACIECGHQVSDQAESCPNCGHPLRQRLGTPPPFQPASAVPPAPKPVRSSSGPMLVLVGLILLVVVYCLVIGGKQTSTHAPAPAAVPRITAAQLLIDAKNEARPASARVLSAEQLVSNHKGTPEEKVALELLPELREMVRKENVGKQWMYTSHTDDMTSKTTVEASVYSTNTHEFDFPYRGPQHATLALRKHPRYGNDVIFSIERGQLQCGSYSGCDVMVRFGDAEPRRYSATGPEDNSTETLFIRGYADFVRRMQSAEVVRIQANTFRQGAPSWEFDVSGFNPDKMK